VVSYLRTLGGGARPAPDPRPARWVRGDADHGERLYSSSCALCHGKAGEGGEGPALRNRVLLEHATDTYLVETVRRGRARTTMPAFGVSTPARNMLAGEDIEAIVAFLRLP
jgi:cytochrome c oxidase cbb3-type subunit 3